MVATRWEGTEYRLTGSGVQIIGSATARSSQLPRTFSLEDQRLCDADDIGDVSFIDIDTELV